MSAHNLIICEKPSVAKTISAVLGATERGDGFFHGNSYIISWCIGHLLELAAPDAYDEKYAKWRYADLPIIPDKWTHIPAKGKAARLKVLHYLMHRADVDCVINACDSGREGENIFRAVYCYAACDKPIKRLWISSMEDAAIREGFDKLRDGAEYDSLAAAASCRERADWIVGYNATRLFTVLYGGATLNVGRVQSPTLAMLARRDAEIKAFVSESFYVPTISADGFTASGERLRDIAAAEAVRAACDGQTAVITAIDRQEKSVLPPKLHDLTALQREANRLLGYTAKQTLDYAQSLYERKILTYPRTDARYITDDMRDTVLKIIGETAFSPDIDRIVGAVSDHHAIIPTLESMSADLGALSSGERNLFELVRKRLIAAVSPKHVYEAVTVTFDCGGHTFTAKGKTVISDGWKTQTDENEDGEDDSTLPELCEGQTFDSVTAAVREGATTAPKAYTEDTLLSAMENAGATEAAENTSRRGLGTPATRAIIIEKIIKAGFAERVKRNILPTKKGRDLIAILPTALTSATLTARWEYMLSQIERGELDGDEFMDGIAAFTRSIVLDNKAPKPEFAGLFAKKSANAPLGVCPRCGALVREGDRGFFCDNGACGFKLWKASKFWTAKKKPLTAAIVAPLLKDGRVEVKGLYSEKTGKVYDATVALDDTGDGFVGYKLVF